ncbi:MAG: phosphohydrolase [Pseudonocardiaceae bacterium]|nr:phosphohydrolase [Pseudonocardiaceae bacterium]
MGPGFLTLPERLAKPRSSGFTHVLDKGLSLVGLESLLQTAGASIDFLKLGWGTAYVSDGVKAKVALCRDAGVNLCLGGTLLEICVQQDRVAEYTRWLRRLGITHVEVSDGALGMPVEQKWKLIRQLSQEFRVLSEVGSKNPTHSVVASAWVTEMTEDLAAGASMLVAEGRESGTVGLYLPSGEVRGELVDAVLATLPAELIIFEAPRKDQQAWFIRRLGPDANLGNIAAEEVVALETLRLGLRSDTLDLLPAVNSDQPRQCSDDMAPEPSTLIH